MLRSGELVGILYILVSLVLNANACPAEGGPEFVVDARALTLSGIRGGETAVYRFPVRNGGGADLEIKGVEPSCDCTTVDFDDTIAPGRTGAISVRIHTQPLQTHLHITFMVETNDPAGRWCELRTDTDIIPAYTINPEPTQSLLTPAGQDGMAVFVVQFNRAENVQWDKHIARIGPVLVHIVPVPGKRNRFTITVTVSHRGIGHDVIGKVYLTPLPASIPTLHFVVERLEADSIVSAPEKIDFGMVARGDTVTRSFIVYSRQQSFHISRAESSDPAISVQYTALPAQVGLYSVTLTLTMPQLPPARRGRVRLHTDGPGQEAIDIPFQFILGIRGGTSRDNGDGTVTLFPPGYKDPKAPRATGACRGADPEDADGE